MVIKVARHSLLAASGFRIGIFTQPRPYLFSPFYRPCGIHSRVAALDPESAHGLAVGQHRRRPPPPHLLVVHPQPPLPLSLATIAVPVVVAVRVIFALRLFVFPILAFRPIFLGRPFNKMRICSAAIQGVSSGRRLGLVGLYFDCSTVCQTLSQLVEIGQKLLGSWAKWRNIQISHPNPGLRPDGTPCTLRII